MKLSSTVFLFLSLFGKASAGGTCACEAEELGWAINCADTCIIDVTNHYI